jgi:hypothetical protein
LIPGESTYSLHFFTNKQTNLITQTTNATIQ